MGNSTPRQGLPDGDRAARPAHARGAPFHWEIARAPVVSRRTVETHVVHILSKVDFGSRIELAEEAMHRFGWRLRPEEPGQPDEPRQTGI